MLQIEDEEQFVTIDGRIVRCAALNLKDEVVAENRRMIFVKGTPPAAISRATSSSPRIRSSPMAFAKAPTPGKITLGARRSTS